MNSNPTAGHQANLMPGAFIPLIKTCGLFRKEDILSANTLRPNFIGFVFAKKSPRYVERETAGRLRALLSPSVCAVGVFVNEDPKTAASLANKNIIDMIQLHGQENEAYIQELRALTKAPVIQAFRVETEADVTKAAQSSADYLLLDNGSGGTGCAFNWNKLQGAILRIKRKFFLAGGLTPENVSAAIARLHPYAVDVSSGIETGGIKDTEKMQRFIDAVRMQKTDNQQP